MRTAEEAGSSRSCTARDGSTRWINPRVAVLTGVEAPTAPPSADVRAGEIGFHLSCARQSSLDFSERVLRSITELEVARHALDLNCAVGLFCCIEFRLSGFTSGSHTRSCALRGAPLATTRLLPGR